MFSKTHYSSKETNAVEAFRDDQLNSRLSLHIHFMLDCLFSIFFLAFFA